MKKQIIITGINGFLGSNLANYLSNDYNVIGLVSDLSHTNRIKDYNFILVESSEENIENLFSKNKIFAVIHAATVYRKKLYYSEFIKNNILFPAFLYETANKYSTKLFLNTDTFFNSSSNKSTYLSPYTLSKKHALEWLREISGQCKLINMKLFHMYGPNDSPEKFVISIINRLLKNEASIDLTLGNQKRDFIYIDDVAEAFATVLSKCASYEGNYFDFEVGTGKSNSIKEFVEIAKKLSKSSSLLNFGKLETRDNEIMDSFASNQNLTQLGWLPTYNLEKGLMKTISNEKNS